MQLRHVRDSSFWGVVSGALRGLVDIKNHLQAMMPRPGKKKHSDSPLDPLLPTFNDVICFSLFGQVNLVTWKQQVNHEPSRNFGHVSTGHFHWGIYKVTQTLKVLTETKCLQSLGWSNDPSRIINNQPASHLVDIINLDLPGFNVGSPLHSVSVLCSGHFSISCRKWVFSSEQPNIKPKGNELLRNKKLESYKYPEKSWSVNRHQKEESVSIL